MDSQVISLLNESWSKNLQHLRYDVYHLPEYINAEARRTQTTPEAIIISEGDKLFCLPYLLRSCEELLGDHIVDPEVFDVVSPYGYPGILINEVAANTPEFLNQALDELMSLLQARNICSAFLRLHPILNQGLNEILASEICLMTGETVSIDLTLSETEIWHQTRPEHRNHINRCKRMGFTAKIVQLREYIEDFISIYNQNMKRVNAKDIYYFDIAYYHDLLNLNNKIHLCIVENENQIACAGIFTECCEIVQYHLGGTSNDFLKQAPSKLMFDYVRYWAKERGNKFLHLGGGLGGSRDSLFHFKTGFSKKLHPFLTLRLITDQTKYNNLVILRAKSLNIEPESLLKSNYFPAYRYTSF